MSGITGLLSALPFICAAALITVIVLIIINSIRRRKKTNDGAARAAGRAGEKYAADIIRSVLCGGDIHFTNVSVSYKNKCVLKDTDELDRAIHTQGRKPLDRVAIESVSKLMVQKH